VGRHIRAHAQELIIFSRGGKTDWGKKRGIFEVLFQPRIDWIDTDMGRRKALMERKL
jgi:hypothetical protein